MLVNDVQKSPAESVLLHWQDTHRLHEGRQELRSVSQDTQVEHGVPFDFGLVVRVGATLHD